MFGIYMNFTSVLVAAAVAYFFGWLWHGPLFGKKWRELEGFAEGQMGGTKMKPMTAMILGFVSTFAFAYGLAWLIGIAGVAFDITGALTMAFMVWLTIVATTLSGSWLWEGKSGKLYVFSLIFELLSICIMTLIIALW